jgi:hypothetical protein
MVVTADNMGDAHINVIHDHREIVCRRIIRSQDDKIIKLAVLKDHTAPDQIVNNCFALLRGLKSDNRHAAGNRLFEVSASACPNKPGHLSLQICLATPTNTDNYSVSWTDLFTSATVYAIGRARR